MNNYYFPHIQQFSKKIEIEALILKLGWAAYGWYWAIMEELQQAKDYQLEYSDEILTVFEHRFNINRTELEHYLNLLIDKLKLLKREGNYFYSPVLKEQMKKIEIEKEKKRKAGLKSAEVRRKKKIQKSKNQSKPYQQMISEDNGANSVNTNRTLTENEQSSNSVQTSVEAQPSNKIKENKNKINIYNNNIYSRVNTDLNKNQTLKDSSQKNIFKNSDSENQNSYDIKTINDTDIINNTDMDNENIKKDTKNNDKIPYKEIIDYLNQKTNTGFKSTTKKTRKLIKARWNEGFRLEDFKKVIDKKCRDWLNNPKMVQYLRPDTLFSSKFESYLQFAIKNINDFDRDLKQYKEILEKNSYTAEDFIDEYEDPEIKKLYDPEFREVQNDYRKN